MKQAIKSTVKKVINGPIYNKLVVPKHYLTAVTANVKQNYPAKGLKVIAVTGTNGKTSTCFLIHRMLVESGYKAGLLSTVAWGVGDDIEPQIHHMTSQPISLLLDRIKKMKSKGMDVLVLEVTSHALAQFRILGVPVDIAVFTNLTHEHLDYHGSFEAYRNAKVKLFKIAQRTKGGMKVGVVNSDDENHAYFAKEVKNAMYYGLEANNKNISATPHNLKLSPKGSEYDVTISGQELHIKCNLPGRFNVANSLAAASTGVAFGLTPRQIERGIAALENVEGRMTRVDEGQGFDILIDFAHTPDSFEKLFKDLRPVVKGRLIALFGSAGRRDEAKRAIQGEIAGNYADIVIATEEDDRDIDGNMILEQIASGAKRAGKKLNKDLFLILDREEAIKFALKTAKKGDTLILLGKGHEKTIERAIGSGGKRDPHNPWEEHPWNEIELTKKLVRKLK